MTKNESHLEEQRQKILDDIAANMMQKVSPKLRESAATFAKVYYANVGLEDLMEASAESLESSVFSMWEFALNRHPEEIKIRLYSKKQTGKDHSPSQTIIEIINDNRPFLVDSVIASINSLGYSTHLVIHPVMKIERDKNHVLKAVFPPLQASHDGSYESLIHCEILGSFSPEKLKILEEEVMSSLQDAKAAVEDWLIMRKQLQVVIKDLKTAPPLVPHEELEETVSFLEWVENNHFTFLGFCHYTLVYNQTAKKYVLSSEEGLGILRDPLRQKITHIFRGIDFSIVNYQQIMGFDPLLITKTSAVSLVHRRDPMDSITVKITNKKGDVTELFQFVGLFTSVAYNKSVWDIPLLRRKVSNIVKRSGFSEQWHDGKTLMHILESFPRDELFQASEDWLFETCMDVLRLQNRQRLTLYIREDRFERFLSCIVYVPRERYDSALRTKIKEILEHALQGTITNWQTQFGELAFARIHFNLNLIHNKIPSYDLKAIEDELLEASLTWRDHLHLFLSQIFGEKKGQEIFERYGKGFSRGYQERFTPSEAIIDIQEIEQSLHQSHLHVSLSQQQIKDKSHVRFRIYAQTGPISLSNVLPVLENMNFKVLSEIPFIITLSNNQKVWMHDFDMRTQEGESVEIEHFRNYFLEGFNHIWAEEIENDGFNKLIVRANLKWQECQLIRAYAKYLRQLQVTFSQTYMEETLAKYPHVCHLLVQLFTCKFDPNSKEDRERASEEILNKIKIFLEDVLVLDEDRILNKFVNAISSTLRTNYYQLKDDKHKPYISIKIDCKSIDEMPLPKPKYEIFIYSPRVEAIHLRGGKVARGGIRWSDRREDFRTEVLGLMKAQMVKNTVIVPVGSKGGFIIKRPPSRDDPTLSLMNEVVYCYQTMMRGLLDLTDNIQGSEVVSPQNVVCWDEDDPYLVVAADKGTATFSDIANQIAQEYDFWLDDAFASGGSSGYDHKKMGITARGAWESVKRHFREMGMNVNEDEITVVGIGDMSGDVFGNGMLLSPRIRLQAAFNHMHIFIDPSPDPAISFKERKRLFNLPASSWLDYNPDLISRGGGVFERKVKMIKMTPEIKALLGIHEDTLTSPDLIRYILKAPVDLMWLGGIGTFIKSSLESNNDVGDRLNDAIRINGVEVRAKVIAEGANLGVTQLGRIEYAKTGGHINTDAIDNSAGVDCSDHEVNIKILLSKVMKEDALTLDDRNQLLKDMTHDVGRLVLKDNFWQNQSISFSCSQGYSLLDEQANLIRDLESEGLLNRALEALPDEKEIARRMIDKQGLTRPELAVLLAYAKLSLESQLIHSELPDFSILKQRLLSYFPERLQQNYHNEILTHPLRREITTTLFTNILVNRMGITFVHEIKRRLGVKTIDVAKAYLIVRELLSLSILWHDVEARETLPSTFQTELLLTIYENVKQMTDWFIRFDVPYKDAEDIIQFFKEDFLILQEDLPSLFPLKKYKNYEKKYNEYLYIGVSATLATKFLTLDSLVSAPDMILLSKELLIDVKLVAKVYYSLGQQLGFDWLRNTALDLSGETLWSQEAANSLIEDFYTNQRTMTKKILTNGHSFDHLFKEDGTISESVLHGGDVESMLIDIMTASTVDFAMMTVINRRLHRLAHGE